MRRRGCFNRRWRRASRESGRGDRRGAPLGQGTGVDALTHGVQDLGHAVEGQAGEVVQGVAPPAQRQQPLHGGLVEAHADHLGRHAADDGVGRHVAGDHAAAGDDGAVADRHALEHQGSGADPDVVADGRAREIPGEINAPRPLAVPRARSGEQVPVVGGGILSEQRGGHPVRRVLVEADHRIGSDRAVAAHARARQPRTVEAGEGADLDAAGHGRVHHHRRLEGGGMAEVVPAGHLAQQQAVRPQPLHLAGREVHHAVRRRGGSGRHGAERAGLRGRRVANHDPALARGGVRDRQYEAAVAVAEADFQQVRPKPLRRAGCPQRVAREDLHDQSGVGRARVVRPAPYHAWFAAFDVGTDRQASSPGAGERRPMVPAKR